MKKILLIFLFLIQNTALRTYDVALISSEKALSSLYQELSCPLTLQTLVYFIASSQGLPLIILHEKEINNLDKSTLAQHGIALYEDITNDKETLVSSTQDTIADIKKNLVSRRTKKIPLSRQITLENAQQVLQEAKYILKNYIHPESGKMKQKEYTKIYFEKNNINRIFAHAYLTNILRTKSLTHVHLPAKYLYFTNLDQNAAQNYIDTHLKMYISKDGFLHLTCTPETHECIILSERTTHHQKPLSTEACKELKELLTCAPFDVGETNIFTKHNGDAIIIDTEYKNLTTSRALATLNKNYCSHYN